MSKDELINFPPSHIEEAAHYYQEQYAKDRDSLVLMERERYYYKKQETLGKQLNPRAGKSYHVTDQTKHPKIKLDKGQCTALLEIATAQRKAAKLPLWSVAYNPTLLPGRVLKEYKVDNIRKRYAGSPFEHVLLWEEERLCADAYNAFCVKYPIIGKQTTFDEEKGATYNGNDETLKTLVANYNGAHFARRAVTDCRPGSYIIKNRAKNTWDAIELPYVKLRLKMLKPRGTEQWKETVRAAQHRKAVLAAQNREAVREAQNREAVQMAEDIVRELFAATMSLSPAVPAPAPAIVYHAPPELDHLGDALAAVPADYDPASGPAQHREEEDELAILYPPTSPKRRLSVGEWTEREVSSPQRKRTVALSPLRL